MPMPTDDEIKACCSVDDGYEAYDARVEDLKDVGYCKQGGSA